MDSCKDTESRMLLSPIGMVSTYMPVFVGQNQIMRLERAILWIPYFKLIVFLTSLDG